MSSFERLRDHFEAMRDDAASWCEGKSPYVRAVLAIYMVYAAVSHLREPMYRSWFGGITLAFHEMGHVVFSPFGRTLMLLGGSVMQLAIPTIAALYLLFRQRDWFGLAVGTYWLSDSMFELAIYVDDANKEMLPLVSLGGQPEHDWGTLLTEWHVLNSAQLFGGLLTTGAIVLSLGATALSGWLFYRMIRH